MRFRHQQQIVQPSTSNAQTTARLGEWNPNRKRERKWDLEAEVTRTALACKASISVLILSCSLSYNALSGLPEPYSMSVSVEAGEVVVVVVVVSLEAGVVCPVAAADFGFLVCESLVEAALVLVGAAMDEEIKDGERTVDRCEPGL
jgi:hypothetical protein